MEKSGRRASRRWKISFQKGAEADGERTKEAEVIKFAIASESTA
jgi:hypothetical protein